MRDQDKLPDGAVVLWHDNTIAWMSLGTNLINLIYNSVILTETVNLYQRGDLLIEGEEWL